MKMNNILKALTLVVVMFVSVISVSARNNDNNLIRNTEEKDGVMVGQTVYKVDGNTLTNYMKYSYSYDDQKRMTESISYKWDSADNNWENDLRMTYTYSGKTVTTDYYKWNKKAQKFVLVPEMTVTMDSRDM
jgi:lipopolysaccharide export LptBFGC system permease protein LptF